jgi:thiol-disulfide isomerase/thioredoxin
MASVVNLLLLVLAISVGTHTAITHLNAKNYDEKLQEAPFTLVYFYSSSCKFCKEFTPVFEKIAETREDRQFGGGPGQDRRTHLSESD